MFRDTHQSNSRRLKTAELLEQADALPKSQRLRPQPRTSSANIYTDGGMLLQQKDSSCKSHSTLRRRPESEDPSFADPLRAERNLAAAKGRIRAKAAGFEGYSRPR